jgi:acyl-CoA dehydrogenase family protein 9
MHGREVREMQYVQKRLAEAAIDLYGLYANIARVENLIRNDHKTADQAFKISDMFSQQARSRIAKNLDDVIKNQDGTLNELADLMYSAKKYPFEILDY